MVELYPSPSCVAWPSCLAHIVVLVLAGVPLMQVLFDDCALFLSTWHQAVQRSTSQAACVC